MCIRKNKDGFKYFYADIKTTYARSRIIFSKILFKLSNIMKLKVLFLLCEKCFTCENIRYL